MGGMTSLNYAGVYPECVSGILNIEGLTLGEKFRKERETRSIDESLRTWIEDKRGVAARAPRRYDLIDEALERMMEQNSFLSKEQALHLTQHGSSQNEDGSYSWKFDNYLRAFPPFFYTKDQLTKLFSNIECPVSFFWGTESFFPIPDKDDWAMQSIKNTSLTVYEKAGHWLHHDQTERFIVDVKAWLAEFE